VKRLIVVGTLLVLAVPASAARLPILASQDWWPVFSPDSGHIAFTRVNGQGRIFALEVVNLTTHRTVQIGAGSGQPAPTWSSDGRIAYASGGNLYEANADGTAKHRYPAPQKAFAPAWRPRSEQLAYLTTHGATNTDLWVAGALWAKDVIGRPAWSPDGSSIAYQREGGIWIATGPQTEDELVSVPTEPGAPAWSPDGKWIAYTAAGRVLVVPADGSGAPTTVSGPFADVGPLAWSPAGDQLAYTVRGGVELSTNEPAWHSQLLVRGAAVGTSYAPGSAHGDVLAYSGRHPGCAGHDAIRLYESATVSGSCAIDGTAGADVIAGTPEAGDVIRAGAGNDKVHANDGHTDRVDCGAGRDEVWADRTDTLAHCELVHR
jgi:hypothetical protein